MKLIAYAHGDGDAARLGVVAESTVHDLTDVFHVTDVGGMLAAGFSVGDIEDLRIRSSNHDLADVRVRAPIGRPGKIICVGLNYHDHCREQGLQPPTYPMLFSKFANAVADPGQPIMRPRATEKLDLECELAVVVGRRSSRIGRSARGHLRLYGAQRRHHA